MKRRLFFTGKFRIWILLGLFAVFVYLFILFHVFGRQNISVQFVMDHQTKEGFTAHLTLSRQCQNSFLGFNMARQIDQKSLFGATIEKNIGDYYLLKLGQSKTVKFSASGNVHNFTDAPKGLFLVMPNKESVKVSVYKIELLDKNLSAQVLYKTNRDNIQTWNKAYPTSVDLERSQSLITPMPVSIKRYPGEFKLSKETKIVIWGVDKKRENEAEQTAQYFNQHILNPATGFYLSIVNYRLPHQNKILLTSMGATSWMGSEGYQLIVTPDRVTIIANTAAGWFYGMQSLRQLFQAKLFSRKLQSNVKWKAPCVTVLDRPRFAYRGLMLDVARHFHNALEVKRLLCLMAMNKLNVFHWHLADDEGWRVPIEQYPMLTQKGGFRGFNEVLPPAYGSGYHKYGGFYTPAEIQSVIQYAYERHINVIPEIDVPGHARALIKSLPNLHADRSGYTTSQFYHDDVLQVCNEETYQVMENIIASLAKQFPGHYIHIGSDEVPDGAWSKSKYCIERFHTKVINKDKMQAYFLKRMQKMIASRGKKLAGWGEISESGVLSPKSTLVYAWQDVNEGQSAAEKGYQVVMVPAQHLYFDLAYNQDPREPGQYWAGYVDTFAAYNFNPVPMQSNSMVQKNVVGVEGALWSENIDSQARMDYLGFPKIAALAEVAWTPQSKRNWTNFLKRLDSEYLPRLKEYGVHYRPPTTGSVYV